MLNILLNHACISELGMLVSKVNVDQTEISVRGSPIMVGGEGKTV
jgi:hypothetical protein